MQVSYSDGEGGFVEAPVGMGRVGMGMRMR